MKIIKNGLIVTMDKDRRVIRNGAVAIDGKFIRDVGKTEFLYPKWPDAEIIDASHHMVLPGFINAHNHLFQILFRGIGDGLPLSEWLSQAIWPLSRYLGRNESYLAGVVSSMEMLSSGITTFVDSHFITRTKDCYDGIAQAIEEIGIRGVIGRSTVDLDPTPPEFRESIDVAISESRRIVETYQGKADGRISVRVEPLNEALASKEMILALKEFSKDYHIGFSMHTAETHNRVEICRERYGYPTVEWLWKLGVLGPNVLLAHCVWVNDTEMDLLSTTHTKVVHNPVANQYLGDGVAPVTRMLKKGIKVAIGTDGASSNNGQDILEAMKSAALLQRVSQLDAGALSASKVLEMTTIDAAQAIGMENLIGSLEPGKLADLLLIDLDVPQFVPSVSALSNLVYTAPSRAVDQVLVNGRTVFQKGKSCAVDQTKLIKECNDKVRRLIDSAGIDHLLNPPRWPIS